MAESNSAELAEQRRKGIERFIELANTMKDEGLPPGLVSDALMSASGVYVTYAIKGNSGGLNQSGVEKVTEMYKSCLENVQRSRKEEQS